MGAIGTDFKPDAYIKSIEECHAKAVQEHEQKCAVVDAIELDYSKKVSKHTTLFAYKGKLETTLSLAENLAMYLDMVDSILCNEVQPCLELDLEAIEFLVCKIKDLAKQIEHQKEVCLKDLNTCIQNITSVELDKKGGIVGALKALADEYVKALELVHTALKDALEVLKGIYLMRYALLEAPEGEPALDPCNTSDHSMAPSASTDKQNNQITNDPCSRVNPVGTEYADCEEQYQQSTKEVIEIIKGLFNSKFPTVEDQITYAYLNTICDQEETAKEAKEAASSNLSYARQCKELAKTKVDGLKAALDAAKNAKAC